MNFADLPDLPITDVLPQLRLALGQGHEAVLEAPPGAGKTTLVPLALLEEAWLAGQRILLLEPRRMAARAAATRMATLLGEQPGETVGYRIRLETCVSERTRIEVVTEGILTRQLQRDPGLEGVGLVIFDEFHERNLDSDLGLALALQAREMFREDAPPLRLLVMSATLDGEAVARLLGGAPVVRSEGRQYPVDIHYSGGPRPGDSLVAPTVDAVLRALREREGNVLVFLPGQGDIRRVASGLAAREAELGDQPVLLAPLYGGLSLQRQQQAIEPVPPGQRKVVLATNIAETSLTIEGIHTVVDAGQAKEAVFDAATGMTRLATRRISRASAEQRSGRAGRLAPGQCYRLWSEEQQARLVDHATPEIRQSDLAPLALQLLAWGVEQPAELAWLDCPPEGPYRAALGLLETLGAAFSNAQGSHQLTPHGVRLAQLPLHPRLAHMLLVGCDIHANETACLLAAVLAERNPLAELGTDIAATVQVLMGDAACPPEHKGWYRRTWQQARRYARIAAEVHKPRRFAISVLPEDVLGVLLASAWPDRVGRAREGERNHQYLLANGRGAELARGDPLVGSEWLAVAEVGGAQGLAVDRIYSAATLSPACFQEVLSPLVRERDHVEWDYRLDQFVAQRRLSIGEIALAAEPLAEVPEEARTEALLGVVRKQGLEVLPWDGPLRQWQARVMLLRKLDLAAGAGEEGEPSRWPDLSDEALMANLEEWLLPWLGPVRNLADFQALDLRGMLHARLAWPLPLELERLAPERFAVPSGSGIAIDYTQSPPVLAVKLQEMFGCEDTPRVADGRVALQLQLLSPAQRPLQVTQDLAGFWRGAYAEVRKEMKGRYPKHPWPEDPVSATPTRYTKKRASAEYH